MTTIISLFILPLGILLYFFDKKTRKQNKDLFDQHAQKIKLSDLSDKEKLLQISDMYYQNGFNTVELTQDNLVVEKKHFNLGVLFIFFGLLTYFGLIFFYIYYKFFLKPERINISLLTLD